MNRPFLLCLLLLSLAAACGDDDMSIPDGGEPCLSDEHCDDGFECTVDTCGVNGFCQWTQVDAVCDEGAVCTLDRGCVSEEDLDAGTMGTDGGMGTDGSMGSDGSMGTDGGMDTDGGMMGTDGGEGMDAGPSCTGDARRCAGTTVEACVDGLFEPVEACAIECAGGACVTDVTCTPSAYRCNGRVVEACSGAGTAWLHVRTCATDCEDGLCVGACEPGERRCNGDAVETCDAGGASWSETESCAGTFCAYGTCALDGLDIATDTDLDGEVYVDGDVLVRSGATLRSPTGDLTIRARSITVESGGAIAVSAQGAGTEGAGERGFFCSRGFNGGTGGGYGTAGTRGPVGGGGSACSNGGRAFGSNTDSDVAQGGPGGDVNGSPSPRPHGGGALRLIATDTITVAGTLTANGENGVRAEGSSGLSTGGGAGGGVLVAANVVDVSGSIQANGGTSTGWGGEGGRGRVKILAGEMRTVTGTLGGTVTEGLLPPLDLASSTHPNPDLFYNDDFASVGLAWDRAFPGRMGYYWLANRSRYTVPTPGSGSFLGTDAVSIAREAFTPGDNYVHVTSVDPTSMVGTVETGFRVRVNATPPSVSSSSHPSETAWSDNRDAFFNWNTPNGPENYVGFYYVLDQYGDTRPEPSDTFLPVTQTTLLRSGLTDGVWVLHVVSVDTRGYLTRVAGHRQVRIGPDPGAGGLVGQVTALDGGAAIAGARVRVNRGIVSDQVTNGTGNYNFMGVPAGTWEVEVAAEGYVTMTRMVTVTDGGSVPLDVSLASE